MLCRCHSNVRRSMMSDHGGKTYRPWEPQRYRQEAHSPEAKLPAGDVVFFLLDTGPPVGTEPLLRPLRARNPGCPTVRSGDVGLSVALCVRCRGVVEPKNRVGL